MGQKVNPVSLRLGYIRGWESNWYGGKTFAEKLVEDQEIRKYVAARIPKGAISKVVIERTLKRITLTIHTARPGVVIGKGGNEVDKIKEELKKLTGKDVQINIYEIKRPELDAKLIGESIAQQLEARISYRRAMKQAIQAAVRVGAQGIKVKLGGRLAGAEMARNEMYKEGRIPLHTLRADIDYAVSEALTVYGKIGIKVWVFKGEVFGKRDLTPAGGAQSQGNERGGEGGGQDRGRGGRDDNRGGGRDNRGGGRDNRGGDNRGGGDRNNRGGNNRGGGPNNRGGNNNNNRGNNNRR
ncbi:30S ribosomal protein S3 [Emticicia agri]|uniref:Small ribosomal subunit protein uS3 n=1 Tax=Emticicia agri TaxID=2492393 RepID=A0A4Q5LW57_9BACT|nr:30S ribosomal protein S3 [Emticicia agri]RYU93938.1 30S ribosomal protein S3 [Emticicia agri]